MAKYALLPISGGGNGPTDPLPDPEFEVVGEITTDAEATIITPGTVVTVTGWPSYTFGGLPAQNQTTRELVVNGVVVTFSETHTAVNGEPFFWRERPEESPGVEWSGAHPTTPTYFVQEEEAEPPNPEDPIGGDVVLQPGVFININGVDRIQPRFTITGDWAGPTATLQWSTSVGNPPLETQIEEIIETDTPGVYTLSHRDGPNTFWTTFGVDELERLNNSLRFRARIGTGGWSEFGTIKAVVPPAPRVLPAAPTGVLITATATDGTINLAADAFSDYGDGEAGELKRWTSATGEETFVAGNWLLPESSWGSTIPVKVYAVDSEGYKGEEVTVNLLIPGTAPVVTNNWAMYHFSSQLAFNNPDQYRFGKSGHQIQFCHGGIRSRVNPNLACFIMDVGGPWVTANAESDWPYYKIASCIGLEQKNSVSGMWDPDIENRYVHVVGGRIGADLTSVGKRTGIYVSEDRGENMVLKYANLWESSSSNASSRSFRQVLNYDPQNHNTWYCLSPGRFLVKSTDRAESWSVVNTGNVPAMGQCWYVQPDYSIANKIWFGAQNGLYVSTNGGTSISKLSPSGLPSGPITSMAFDEDDNQKFLVVVGAQGIYRTTNGGTSFTRLSTPTQYISQVFQSQVNKNRLWYMGINAEPQGAWGKSTGAVSTNGGSSWTTCTTNGMVYGIDRGNNDLMRASWAAPGNGVWAMQTGILPSPLDEDRAIGTWGVGLWRTNNGVHWDLASDGFSNQAGGDTNFGSMDFTPDGRIAFAAFDKRAFFSPNSGDWWRGCSFTSAGVSSNDYVGLSISLHETKPKMLTVQGFYNPNPGSVILSYDNGATSANSKRPSFFSSNYGANDFQKWVHFHKTGSPNVAYCTTAISFDEGETWTKWIDRADAVYRNNIGEPKDKNSRAGVRMCSPKDNDWLIATPDSGGGMYLSKDKGLTWKKFTNNAPAIYGSDIASLWMDPTDRNIIYWWQPGVGLKRYNEATQTEVVCPGTTSLSNLRVQRVRSSYQTNQHIYIFNRSDGESMVYRSTTGWNGTFEDISGNLPRQIGNQGFEIDPFTGILWMNGVIGTRIFPPPGGSDRWNVLYSRSGEV